jgi:hypothetical protein
MPDPTTEPLTPPTETPTTVVVLHRATPESEPTLVTVMAETTSVPGLVINPTTSKEGFTGDYTLTHTASGYCLFPRGMDLWTIRDIATELATVGIDFTASKEAVIEAITANRKAYVAAVNAGRYPAPQSDPDDQPKNSEIAPYPRSDAQATADAISRHLTRCLQYRTRDTWALVGRDDPEGRRAFRDHAATMIAQWGLVTALREIAQIDPVVADGIARKIYNGWNDGSDTHEDPCAWAREYGLPPLPETDVRTAAYLPELECLPPLPETDEKGTTTP